ncbi:putative signal recognition particle 54 kDa protein 1-like [Capsicum annuum]|nr:putative signal recognition particle 54 kDa protein 1-like [Capsicum annuum]
MEAAAMRPNAANFPATYSISASSLQPQSAAGVSFIFPKSVRLTSSFRTPMIVRASDPKTDQSSPTTDEPSPPFLPQEDLNFLVKLGVGSVAGGAVIKYGSVIFPEITTPNISLALFMISAPMIVAAVLLFLQSSADSKD